MDKLPEEINQEIFENKYEKKLYDYYSKLNLKYNDNCNNLIFDASTIALFTESIDIIEKFFDHTLVNENDNKLRNNRLKLLYDLEKYFSDFANFEKIED